MPLTGFGTVAFDPEDVLAARLHKVDGHRRVVCVLDVGTTLNDGISRVELNGAGAVALWKIIDPSNNSESGCVRFSDWALRMNRIKFIEFPEADKARVYFVTSRAGTVASIELEGKAAARLAGHFPESVPERT
jgi:hypothetical protein